MTSILVGLDGSLRGERALAWAVARAKVTQASLALITVVDPSIVRVTGLSVDTARQTAENLLRAHRVTLAKSEPELEVRTQVAEDAFIDAVVDAVPGNDLVVVGSHKGATLAETIGGAKGLKVSVAVDVPVVVVPANWSDQAANGAVVVGVGPDDVSDAAVRFGAETAAATGVPLQLVSVWGVPALLARPAEAMGGGLSPVRDEFEQRLSAWEAQLVEQYPGLHIETKTVEGSPAKALSDVAAQAGLLVLGTHARGAVGRALFGSVTHGVLSHLTVPTVVVPNR